jgi:hypothetical protein|tara:strand:- start:326 stop:1015 length:690 start_codon:yes stop_codon:yes gene_type:complete
MIFIDTVYQRVLTLANKEQRGYITPQEFNLLANQAQMEIFEQYFYDAKSEDKNLKNSTEFSNVDEMLDEKISAFKNDQVIAISGGTGTLPTDLHRLGSLYLSGSMVEVEQVTEEELMYLHQSPLARPTLGFPAFVRGKIDKVKLYPPTISGVNCRYIVSPNKVAWGYIVLNEKALYNAPTSVNFQLHESDEAELVYKILALAGVVIAKVGIKDIANQEIATQKAQEKQQ